MRPGDTVKWSTWDGDFTLLAVGPKLCLVTPNGTGGNAIAERENLVLVARGPEKHPVSSVDVEGKTLKITSDGSARGTAVYVRGEGEEQWRRLERVQRLTLEIEAQSVAQATLVLLPGGPNDRLERAHDS